MRKTAPMVIYFLALFLVVACTGLRASENRTGEKAIAGESGDLSSSPATTGFPARIDDVNNAAPSEWIITDSDGTVVDLSDDQVTAINTMLLRLDEPLVLRPAEEAENDLSARGVESGALGAVDDKGNLAKPGMEEFLSAIRQDLVRREFSKSELVDPNDASQGVKARAAHNYSFGTLNEEGEVVFTCVPRGETLHSCSESTEECEGAENACE